jgi:3-deoxy-D-arabino-heptulosonate 7-phosphate (DAHP) synthase
MDSERLKTSYPLDEKTADIIKRYRERIQKGEPVVLIGPYALSTIGGGIELAKLFRTTARKLPGREIALMQVTFGSIEERIARQVLLDIASMQVPVAMEHPPSYLEDIVVHVI